MIDDHWKDEWMDGGREELMKGFVHVITVLTCAAPYRPWSGRGGRFLILPSAGVYWLLHLVSSDDVAP